MRSMNSILRSKLIEEQPLNVKLKKKKGDVKYIIRRAGGGSWRNNSCRSRLSFKANNMTLLVRVNPTERTSGQWRQMHGKYERAEGNSEVDEARRDQAWGLRGKLIKEVKSNLSKQKTNASNSREKLRTEMNINVLTVRHMWKRSLVTKHTRTHDEKRDIKNAWTICDPCVFPFKIQTRAMRVKGLQERKTKRTRKQTICRGSLLVGRSRYTGGE